MRDKHRSQPTSPDSDQSEVYSAWERFVQGEDDVRGVRPEVAVSWQRCREKYQVDPYLTEAPAAFAEIDHTPEHDVVFAELGFRAATMAHEVASLGGIVTITDATGRILAEWGDQNTLSMAHEAHLAPWFSWSEYAVGTNGMGTALENYAPTLIRGPEHWCQGFHGWTCAGVAVRDVITQDPIAVLNISCWRNSMPGAAGGWLANAASKTQHTLRRRARDSGTELLAVYNQERARPGAGALAAMDAGGRVVIADDTASTLLGVPASTPVVDPTLRWSSGLPELVAAARAASKEATRHPDWVGTTQIFTRVSDQPVSVSIRPVFLSGHLVGNIVSFGNCEGEAIPQQQPRPCAEAAEQPRATPRRVVAMREERMVLLRPSEVSFAESEGNTVWLATDQGRLRAASPGLDKLDAELSSAGFLRVHRRYVVNVNRIREIERRMKGELALVMDDKSTAMVPVSRRNAPTVRQTLGL